LEGKGYEEKVRNTHRRGIGVLEVTNPDNPATEIGFTTGPGNRCE